VNYWLLKSEPDVFSIADLKKRPGQTEPWDGIRNYQARNFIRDDMRPGDQAFFYHSNCDVPGIAGIMKVASAARPDPTAFDQNHIHFDPKSKSGSPAWYLVEVKFVKQFKRVISLNGMREHKALSDMRLLQKGNRLSVMPVTVTEWKYILNLE